MINLKFAFSTNAFRRYSVEESITLISQTGYEGIELMCDIPHAFPPLPEEKIASIKNSLLENKIAISNLNGFMMSAIGDFHHPSWIENDVDFRKKRIEHTKDCIRLAAQLGAKSVSTEPGGPLENISREDAYNIFEDGLNEVIPVAEKNKIMLLIEPEPELLIESSTQFVDFISRFDSKYLALNFDLGHFYCVGEDPARLVKTLGKYIFHVHLEDISQDRIHNHLIPGRGSIDFSEVFLALESINYKGFVTVELYPYLDNPTIAASEALAFLRKTLPC